MTTVLVTGGTGGLGRPTVQRMRQRGFETWVLSRKPGDGHRVADLSTGEGVAHALEDIDVVVHLATTRFRDLKQTRRLLDAMREAGTRHLVFVSIVGVDRVPYGYYRDKVRSEQAIAESGVPFTILRATQFHGFVADAVRAQRRSTVWLPDVPVQPIATEEVAERLVELASAEPAGRVADIGGPEVENVRVFAEQWLEARGERKRIRMLRLPGRLFGAYRRGEHLAGLPGHGRVTFREWAAAQEG